MSEHKMQPGKEFIWAIEVIGQILGYHCTTEFPIGSNSNSAVDVAWLKDKGQKFPLFIFEVESTSTNSMAGNPAKVYGKQTFQFQKPLFFFHIVLTGGSTSDRVKDLQSLFGSHNYRIYTVEQLEENQNLLFDILDQHRKLTDHLDISSLSRFILETNWSDIPLSKVLDHILHLGFEKKSGDFLPHIGSLAIRHKAGVTEYCRFLTQLHGNSIEYSILPGYEEYFGTHWFIPVHLGIISLSNDNEMIKQNSFNLLKLWQFNDGTVGMIVPYFQLSQDYGKFLVTLSGGHLAIIGALFYDRAEVRLYLCEVLLPVIEKTKPEFRTGNYLWLTYIAPHNAAGDEYRKKASAFFLSAGFYSFDLYDDLEIICGEDYMMEFTEGADISPSWSEQLTHSNKIDHTELIRGCILLLLGVVSSESITTRIKEALSFKPLLPSV